MLIKELEDMLALVKELPREDQLKCAQSLWLHVDEWEARQQELHLSDAEWADLKAVRAEAERRLKERRDFEEMGVKLEPRFGVVASFNRKKGYGYIQMADGERALLHVSCLRASGYFHAAVGAPINFEAVRRPHGWQAFRVLTLGDRRPRI